MSRSPRRTDGALDRSSKVQSTSEHLAHSAVELGLGVDGQPMISECRDCSSSPLGRKASRNAFTFGPLDCVGAARLSWRVFRRRALEYGLQRGDEFG